MISIYDFFILFDLIGLIMLLVTMRSKSDFGKALNGISQVLVNSTFTGIFMLRCSIDDWIIYVYVLCIMTFSAIILVVIRKGINFVLILNMIIMLYFLAVDSGFI